MIHHNMNVSKNQLLYNLLLVSLSTTLTHGRRNFEIYMDTYNCTSNPTFAACEGYVDKTIDPPKAFFDLRMRKEMAQAYFSLEVFASRKDSAYLLFNSTGNDYCWLFERKEKPLPKMISILRDVLHKTGQVSEKCPVDKVDHIEDDCREINCPKPEFDCPADSELKSTVTEDSEENDEHINSNPFDRLAAEGLIEGFFPTLKLESTTHPPHVVEKRSLQHRRREAIKIVPGDYRSFEPEFFKYHNHHQPHRKWKRDLVMGVQPHSEAAIKKCCPEFQCVCKACPAVPKCKGGKVAIVVDQGHGLPGSCCPRYECVPEIECTATSQSMASYWRDECKKCDCFGGQELCQQLCVIKEDDSANNCFSGYLNRPMMNGESWLEDEDCKECKCVNGDAQCEGSFCKPVDCENPVKVEGRCCKICPVTTSTTTEGAAVNTTIVVVTTTGVPVTSTEAPTTRIFTTRPITTTTATTSTTTTSSTPITTTTSTTPTTTTSSTPITTTTTTTTSTTSSTITTATESDEFITEDDATTYLPPTVIISTPKKMGDLWKQIDVIVVLALATLIVVVCTLGIIYMVKQSNKKKKSMYSTIPSSESSQSSRVTLA